MKPTKTPKKPAKKAPRAETLLDDKFKEMQREARLVILAIEQKMVHMRRLLDANQVPILYSDIGRDDVFALGALFSGMATAQAVSRELKAARSRRR
jgi:hypothetical protein